MKGNWPLFLLSNVYKKRFEFRWDYLNFAFLKIE